MNLNNQFKKNLILKKYKIPKNILIIYGYHSCISALKNTKREKYLMLTNKKNLSFWLNEIQKIQLKLRILSIDEKELDIISNNNVHQNALLFSYPLEKISINQYLNKNFKLPNKIILLDQITDTQNIGSIIRSAFAFNFNAIGLLKNNSPSETSSMIKASSGEIEKIILIELKNLANEIKLLKNNGFHIYGLSNEKKTNLKTLDDKHDKIVLVLGSEAKGLRKLTKDCVDEILYIPINRECNSLNASNAAAIAMYHLT